MDTNDLTAAAVGALSDEQQRRALAPSLSMGAPPSAPAESTNTAAGDGVGTVVTSNPPITLSAANQRLPHPSASVVTATLARFGSIKLLEDAIPVLEQLAAAPEHHALLLIAEKDGYPRVVPVLGFAAIRGSITPGELAPKPKVYAFLSDGSSAAPPPSCAVDPLWLVPDSTTRLGAATYVPSAVVAGTELLRNGGAWPGHALTELRARAETLGLSSALEPLWKWLRFAATWPTAVPMRVTDRSVLAAPRLLFDHLPPPVAGMSPAAPPTATAPASSTPADTSAPALAATAPPSTIAAGPTMPAQPNGTVTTAEDDTDDEGPPLLPAVILANILDYSLYADVRTCMLAGKTMSIDAARLVTALNITQSSQLDVRAVTARFPAVEEVNIFCLVERHVRPWDHRLDANTLSSIVPFLVCFDRLKRAHVGGINHKRNGSIDKLTRYCAHSPYVQENHEEMMRGLILAFCGAFRTNALPRDLDLSGIVTEPHGNITYKCPSGEDSFATCTLCRQVCETFPLRGICGAIDIATGIFSAEDEREEDECYCLSRSAEEVFGVVATRQGGLEFLSSSGALEISYFLYERRDDYFDDFENRNVERDQHVEETYYDSVVVIRERCLAAVTLLVERYGLSPSEFSTDEMMRFFSGYFARFERPGKKLLLAEETFQRLLSLGFNFDGDFFEVVNRNDAGKIWYE